MPRFGVAKTYAENLPDYLEELKEEEIDLYEAGFVYSIPSSLKDETIEKAEKYGIKLTFHLPLWINLANNEKRDRDIGNIVSGMNIAEEMGSIGVFHTR